MDANQQQPPPVEELRTMLRDALELACQCQAMRNIEAGREMIVSLPRQWIVDNIEQAANTQLNLDEEWEYRRLVELFLLLDKGLAERLIERGKQSPLADIREAAADLSNAKFDSY